MTSRKPLGEVPLLLFADLDGTLVVEPEGVGPRLVDLIRFVRSTGGAFVPTSARPVPNLASILGTYLAGSAAIGSGGGVIAELNGRDSFKPLHEEVLDPALARSLLPRIGDWRRTRGGLLFLFQGSRARFEVAVAGSDETVLSPNDLRRIVGSRPLRHIAGPARPAEPLLGISLLAPGTADALEKVRAAIDPPPIWRASVYPEYRIPGWTWLELFPRSASKESACRRVVDLWTAANSAVPVTAAVGDAVDDVGMLGSVDISVCPRDASAPARVAGGLTLPESGGEDFAAALPSVLASHLEAMLR